MSRPGKIILAFPSDGAKRRPGMSIEFPISDELADDPDGMFLLIEGSLPDLKLAYVEWLAHVAARRQAPVIVNEEAPEE